MNAAVLLEVTHLQRLLSDEGAEAQRNPINRSMSHAGNLSLANRSQANFRTCWRLIGDLMPAQHERRKGDLERVNKHRKCLVRLDKPQRAPFTGRNPEKPWESAQGRKVGVERPLLLAPAAAGFLRSPENSGSRGFDTQFVGINLPVPQWSSHPSSISQLKEPT